MDNEAREALYAEKLAVEQGFEGLTDMDSKYVTRIKKLGFEWETNNPFLFCVHHLDHYPRGNEMMGPAASLSAVGYSTTARMRRTPADEDCSLTMRKAPSSPVCSTWGPPQTSVEKSPTK